MATRRVDKLFETDWFSFEAITDENSIEPYYRISSNDSVGVLATTPDGRILLVSQYRPAIDEMVLEFPGGQLEDGENPEEAIKRELLEETGYVCDKLVYLGAFRIAAFRIDSKVHAFFGADARLVNKNGEQGIDVVPMTKTEFLAALESGQMKSLPEVGILRIAEARGLL